jgi:uncharacterized membrane protein YdbT with pleckstrin-like domain
MENLHYNLSEEEFSKSRKVLLWGFAVLFLLAGIYVLFVSLVLGRKSMPVVLAAAPMGISLIVGIIAAFASIKRKNLFFSVDDEKIEFRYGLLRARKHSFKWNDISELVMPHKQKKAKLILKDGSSFIINLTWLQRKKSSIIKKHIYMAAREKGLLIKKPAQL